jgi:hypothetical protein
MVDYTLRSNNWKQPEPGTEVEQEVLEPVVDIDVVWNVYQEKGNARSMALKVSLRLPSKS